MATPGETWPRLLDLATVDRTTAGLTHLAGSVHLDLARLDDAMAGVEGSVLGLLAQARRTGLRVVVRLPDVYGPEGLPPSSRSTDLIGGRLVGFLLARLAHTVEDARRRDVTDLVRVWQRSALRHSGGVVGAGSRLAYPLIDDFPGAVVSDLLRSATLDDSAELRTQLMTTMRRFGSGEPPEESVEPVVTFLAEALENTSKHATTDLSGQPIGGVRYLSMRHTFATDLTNGALRPPDPVVADWYSRLESRYGRQSTRIVVELGVSDCGEGIPGRRLGSTSVYDGDHAREREVLQAAFHASLTKPAGNLSWAGMGLRKMLDATAGLDALLQVRTGRCLASRHYLARRDDDLEVDVETRARPLTAGTHLSLLVPWRPAQGALLELG